MGFTGSDWIGAALLLLTFVVWTAHLRVGWNHAHMAGQEFRQSQTALSIQAIERDGFRLDYATPVLGKPWAIPMEFPLYQWCAAGWVDLSGHEVVVAGRWVALLAFLAGLPAVLLILRSVGLSWGAGFMILALIVSTPVYAFFSASVLIESMAWSASCWFLWGVLRHRSSAQDRYLMIAFAAGAIAVLVKPTTWAVACLPWAVLWLRDLTRFKRNAFWQPLLKQALVLGVGLLLLAFGWIAFADNVKSQNPIAHFLLSAELTNFNFGSWATKFSSETWDALMSRWQSSIVSWIPLVLGVTASLAWSHTRALALCGLLGFLGIQLIFTNLYVAHDYYFYANAAYLVVAVVAGLAGWWDRSTRIWFGKLPAGLLFVALLGMNFAAYRDGLFRRIVEQGDEEPRLPALIRSLTESDDVIVAHSGDWNSAMAFHSQRRMLMIPDSQMFFHPDKVNQNIALLADESVPLLMVQGEAGRQSKWVAQRVLQLELHPFPLFVWSDTITVYSRMDRYEQLAEQLRGITWGEISVPEDDGMVQPKDLPALSAEVRDQIAPALSALPDWGRFPHGVNISEVDGSTSLLVHAPTELAFRIPEGATRIELAYIIPAHVYLEPNFDGLTVVLELWGWDERQAVLLRDWMPSGGQSVARVHEIDLARKKAELVLLRVEAGPANLDAFDQAWLKSFRFR